MHAPTGRIELITTNEDERDAKLRGLVPLTPAQLGHVAPMSRSARRAWASRHIGASPATVRRAAQRDGAERKAARKRQRNARKANR